MNTPAISCYLHGARTANFALLITTLFAGIAQASTDNQEALFQSMKARQVQLEAYMIGSSSCLGERLDGILEINITCSSDARTLAEAENSDRMALNKLISIDIETTANEVGQQRAENNLEFYREGIQREVRLSPTETTWWDGRPPDPRKTAVSRVLALNNALIYDRPDSNSQVVRDNIQQYEAFGVIGSQADASGSIWFQVTEEYIPKIKPANWSPKALGWISQDQSIPWRRALVMRFTSSLQRDPSLFFKTVNPLLTLINLDSNSRTSQLQRILTQVESGRAGGNGVLAVEPQVGLEQQQAIFYPVLDYYSRSEGEPVRIDGNSARLLEVAARTRTEKAFNNQSVPIDIMFVMDTTNSMVPYLKNVLAAAEESTSSTDKGLKFGFIGYQDKDSDFEYETREFTRQLQTAKDFVYDLRRVKARNTPVKGDDIPESVFEGINAALESRLWRENAVKVIFLVGDAPGREDMLNIKILRDKASLRQVRIFAFHIHNSSVSKRWDKKSQKQYKELTLAYKGDPCFGVSSLESIDAGATAFHQIILNSFKESLAALRGIRSGKKLPDAKCGSISSLIFQQAALLMPDSSLPEADIRGWVSDKVLNNSDREALAPMILLTESELDQLEQRVRELKDIGEEALRGDGTTLDFFDLVSKNTRFTMVDPNASDFRNAFSAPLGIDQLPYDSDIMAATRDEFENDDKVMDFVSSMENKLRHYEDLRRQRGNPAIWKKLSAGAQDRVIGVELNQLP